MRWLVRVVRGLWKEYSRVEERYEGRSGKVAVQRRVTPITWSDKKQAWVCRCHGRVGVFMFNHCNGDRVE